MLTDRKNISKTKFRFTAIDLSTTEIEAIKKLFALVQEKSVNNWSYVQPVRGEHFDIVLAKENPVGGFTFDLMVLFNDQVSTKNQIKVNWPLRVLDVFRYVRAIEEKHGVYKRVRAGTLTLDLHKKLKNPGDFNNILLSLPNASFVLIDIKHKRVLLMSDSDSTIKLLLSYQSSEIYFSSTRTPKNFAWKQSISLRAMFWRLGIKEDIQDVYSWSLDSHMFRFKQFPYLSGLEIEPYMLKLASLFSRRACTLRMALEFTKLDQKSVMQFLHACIVIGTPFSVEKNSFVLSNLSKKKQSVEKAKTNDMLNELKDKLGAVYSKTVDEIPVEAKHKRL